MNKLKGAEPKQDQRRAGVLLHPTSLPGKRHQGDIGIEARNFMHFMADCGLSLWQMLPIGPPHADGSPYQCLSAHAGNPELICLEWLQEKDWLTRQELDHLAPDAPKLPLLETAGERFFEVSTPGWHTLFDEFVDSNQCWLTDYALFMVLKQINQQQPWTDWPEKQKMRDAKTLDQIKKTQHKAIQSIQFIQFIFFTQWAELKEYADSLNIQLFGDMPIFVSMDSACVWSHRDNFLIDDNGRCEFVAGVPPDAFSDDGQLWGNPLFHWENMKKQGFGWWINRFKTQLKLFDHIRIDHFRGLQACWQIPAEAETAKQGKWVESPGEELLNRLHDHFQTLPLIAEDLGFITPEVRELRDQFKLPGMVILQFAYDGDPDNLYLPHNHHHNSVVYTGTHDNDTTLGWYQSLEPRLRTLCCNYLGHHRPDMPWAFNRLALASVARLAILPMQDLLSLDSKHRMNTPGTTVNNWRWRFDWSQVWPGLAPDLAKLIKLYGRHPD